LDGAVATGRIEVTCVVDPNVQRRTEVADAAQDLTGARPRAFSTLEDALVSDPDRKLFEACAILTPPTSNLHEKLSVLALESARSVLLEPPLSRSLKAADALLRVASDARRASGAVFMVAESAQYWPEVVAAAAAIRSGRIGQVLSASARCWEAASGSGSRARALKGWLAKGPWPHGFVSDAGQHWIRALTMMLGPIESLVAAARRPDGSAGASVAHAILRFHGGSTATFEAVLAPASVGGGAFFRVLGDRGEIVVGGLDGGCELFCGSPAPSSGGDGAAYGTREMLCPAGGRGAGAASGLDASFRLELADFAAAVLDGAAPACTVEQARRDLAAVEAIFRSAETGRWCHPTGRSGSGRGDRPPADSDSDDDATSYDSSDVIATEEHRMPDGRLVHINERRGLMFDLQKEGDEDMLDSCGYYSSTRGRWRYYNSHPFARGRLGLKDPSSYSDSAYSYSYDDDGSSEGSACDDAASGGSERRGARPRAGPRQRAGNVRSESGSADDAAVLGQGAFDVEEGPSGETVFVDKATGRVFLDVEGTDGGAPELRRMEGVRWDAFSGRVVRMKPSSRSAGPVGRGAASPTQRTAGARARANAERRRRRQEARDAEAERAPVRGTRAGWGEESPRGSRREADQDDNPAGGAGGHQQGLPRLASLQQGEMQAGRRRASKKKTSPRAQKAAADAAQRRRRDGAGDPADDGQVEMDAIIEAVLTDSDDSGNEN
jgi:predicted dehydrogenase